MENSSSGWFFIKNGGVLMAKRNPEFCPYCGQPLIKSGEKRKMETLSEHVSCSSVSEKEVYVCSAGCKFSKLHIWNEDPFGDERGNSFISDYWHECFNKSKDNEDLKRWR